MTIVVAYETDGEGRWRVDEVLWDGMYVEYDTVGAVAVLKDPNGEVVKKLDGDDPRPVKVYGEVRV